MRARLSSPGAVLFACLFASQAGLLVLSPILPELADEFGISTPAAGQLRTLTGAVGGLTALLLVFARRRPGLRTMLAGGAGLVALASALSALAPSFAVLAAGQAVMGAGIGVLVAVGIAAAGEWTQPAERARTLAWAIAGMPAAWIVGMPIAGLAASVDWRFAWAAVPGLAALGALLLICLRPADAPVRRSGAPARPWSRPDVLRYATGELLANAAWASVLTYSGALLIDSYGASRSTVAVGLGVVAVAMLPGTYVVGRRNAAAASQRVLVALTLSQALAVTLLGAVTPAVEVTLGVLVVMAFTNGWRSVVASALGMDTSPGDAVALMSVRAAANQFGYLLGAAVGGAALAIGGFLALGGVLGILFVAGAAVHAMPVGDPLPEGAPA